MRTFKRLQEQAFDYLKDRILEGKFEPDVVYSETRLAEEIGISRTPIRDALQRLSQDGFIDILPSKGFVLHKMTQHDVLETNQMRSAIEGYCALMIAKEFETEKAQKKLDQLHALLETQREMIASNCKPDKFVDIDQEFHIQIVAYANNSSFNETFHNFMHRINVLAIKSFEAPGRLHNAFEEHKAMLTAMASGDVAHIYEVTLFHMEAPKLIVMDKFPNWIQEP